MTTTTPRVGPRQRLLDAAKRLTYSDGPNVGVDALLNEADAARRSLYEHFGGKDGLLVEVAREAAVEDEDWTRAALDAGGREPRRRLLAIFDALDRIVAEPEFRGCRYLSLDLGIPDPDHPIHAQTAEHRLRVRKMLEAELKALGHPSVRRAAQQIQLLMEGVLAVGAAKAAPRPGRLARAMAEGVLDQAG